MNIEELRLLTLGDSLDTSRDELLELLYARSEARLLDVIKQTQKKYGAKVENIIPEELKWIVDEVTIQRFNRLGSEGMTSESVNGHSVSFASDDFAEFQTVIDLRYKPPDEGRVVIY